MDTLNNMAVSAAKVVWGEDKSSTEEPVAGRLGDTAKGEPYDAGNMEPISEDAGQKAASMGDAMTSPRTANGDAGHVQLARRSDPPGESHDTPVIPAAEQGTKTEPDDSGERRTDAPPRGDSETNAGSESVGDRGAPGEELQEDQQFDSPGPKPVQEIAKEHGGDAGSNGTTTAEGVQKEDDGRRDQGAEDHQSDDEGTGERYVKSTGLQADGGDFDASKPGAGKEAERLMEEKDMRNPAAADPNGKGGNDDSHPGKKSIGQKIKDKLHRH